jgi:hypothetical protein
MESAAKDEIQPTLPPGMSLDSWAWGRDDGKKDENGGMGSSLPGLPGG